MDFIFGHEITHITNGHLGVINKTRHPDPEKRRSKLSSLENQAIELDADGGATEWTLQFTEFVRNSRPKLPVEADDPLGISWREFYATETNTVGFCFMASYLTLRMTSPDYWNPANQQNIYQPLPPYRMGTLMKVYASVLMQLLNLSFEDAQTQIGVIIGNRKSQVYHLSVGCPSYGQVSEKNQISFTSESEAQAAGYRKAGNCK